MFGICFALDSEVQEAARGSILCLDGLGSMIYNRSFVNDHNFVVWMYKRILTCHGYDHDHQGGCPHKEAALALGLTLELADFCCEPPVGYTREQFLKAGFQISVWPL